MNKIGILIVEDEITLSEVYTHIFESLFSENDLRIFTTNNCLKALKILEKNHDIIKLVTTDINHLGLNGIEMSQIMKERFPEVKILVMTAFGSKEIERKCDKLVNAFFHKPVTISEFRICIKKLLIIICETVIFKVCMLKNKS